MDFKYAVSTWIYGSEPLEKTLIRLQRFGYHGVELTAEPDMDVGKIKALVGRHDLCVSNLLGNWSWELRRDISNLDAEVRAHGIEYARRGIDLAAEFGALSFMILPSAVGKPGMLAAREQEIKWARDSVAEVARHAAEMGIYLTVEMGNRYEVHLINNVDQVLDFVHSIGSPWVKILIDFFHANIEEPEPVLAVFKGGNLIYNVHLADSNRQAIGNGHIDFRSILRALKQIGYPHYLTLEPVPPGGDPTNIGRGFTAPVSDEQLDRDAGQSISLLRLYEQVS